MQRVAITGAAGGIGTTLRAGLADRPLRLLDVRSVDAVTDNEDARLVDLRDAAATQAALAGVDAVVHLAAWPDEAAFERILDGNIRTTYHVFEAARQQSVRRVIFASSVHVSGFHPWGRRTSPQDPVRPDTYYAVSKVFGEALGRLYADKHGLEVVCIRIAGFSGQPDRPEFLSGWLSPRDAVRLFRAALDAPDIGYLTCYGLSANTRGFYTSDGWAELGYVPQDDAEVFADRWPDAATRPPALQGVEFTAVDYAGSAEPPHAAVGWPAVSRLSRSQVYAVLGILVGLTFALEGILGAPGRVFAITGVVTAAVYGLLGVTWLRGGSPDRDERGPDPDERRP